MAVIDRRLDQLAGLLRRERRDLVIRHPRRIDELGDIAADMEAYVGARTVGHATSSSQRGRKGPSFSRWLWMGRLSACA